MSLYHYVPNLILRNFADDDGVLWIMDKKQARCWLDKGGGGTYDNAFAEHDYNPSSVEKVLNRIESKARWVVEKIIDLARCGMDPVVEPAEKGHLCTFLFVQALRIPRVKSWVMNEEWEFDGDKDILWQMFSDLSEDKYPGSLEAEKANANLTEHPHLEKIIWLRMMDMSMDVLRISSKTGAAFLISDEPCLMKRRLAHPGDRVIMPLAKDVCIQLSRPEDSSGGLHEIRGELVEELNVQSYTKARRFVAGPAQQCLGRVRDLAERAGRSTGGLVI